MQENFSSVNGGFLIMNMTPYEQFQLERYGNILPDQSITPEAELYENGMEELERLSEWIEQMAELELDR